MGKQAMQIESEKSMQGIIRRYSHNVRKEGENQKGHIDSERTKNNVELIGLPKDVHSPAEFFKKRISELDYYKTHHIRKNAILCQEIVLGYGMDGLPEDFSVSKWAKQSEQYLKDIYGEENIISAVVHMDESAPHIHALVMPIVNGKLSARQVTGDRNGLRALHTRYYEDYMKECGLEPEDVGLGSVVKGNMTQYYKALDRVFQESLPEKEPGETDKAYYDRVNQIYQDQMLVKFKHEHDIGMLKRENERMKKYIRHRESQLKKEYEGKLEEKDKSMRKEKDMILDKIGGDIERASEAVQFKTYYDDIMQHAIKHYPEKAKEINDGLNDLEEMFIQDIEKEKER